MIEIKHLTRNYGNNKGVFDLSIKINEGEVFGFLGPNGAGKTTTIRHLMGFIKTNQGKCTIDGYDCWKDADKIQKDVGYVPGEMTFFDEMTGYEYLLFIQKYRGLNELNRKEELIERFELNPSGKIKKMSKGMKQKIGIVAALMHDPKIIILDEPTSGLDPLMQNRFIDLIKEEKAKGKTILLSSHIFEEVERTCDRIGIIKNGRLVALDTTEELRKKHLKTYVVTLDNEFLAKEFAKDFAGKQLEKSPTKVMVAKKQSLEEIFLTYYGGNNDD